MMDLIKGQKIKGTSNTGAEKSPHKPVQLRGLDEGGHSLCSRPMNNLVAYSDDEDDELAGAGTSKGATAAARVDGVKAVNGSGEGVKDSIRQGDEGEKGASQPAAVEKESSTSVLIPGVDSVLHLLPPPPRVSSRPGANLSAGSTASSSKEPDPNQDPDPYWGLSSNEKAMTDIDDPLYRKLANFHKLKEEQGTHFNQSLNRNRSFRNPHIYSKLVQWVEVEETGSAYCDMVKEEGGRQRGNADAIWSCSARARAELKRQGGKDVIAALQRKRQEEADERKKRARRENIDFVASTSSPSRQTIGSVGARGGEGGSGGDRERERHRERERERERDRHRHRHHRERR